MFFATRRAPQGLESGSKARRRRSARKAVPQVDGLERREVMSHASAVQAGIAQATVHAARSNGGNVAFIPPFYEFYVGPRLLSLDVVEATGTLTPSRGLVLRGTMAGRINRRPLTDAQSQFYVFGINRGLPNEVSPFFHRPGVRFDSVVIVAVTPTGTSGFVRDLTAPTGTADTPINPRDIRVSGRNVTVNLNPNLLLQSPIGNPIAEWTFNLWARSSLAQTPLPNHGSFVASFFPFNSMASVFVQPNALTGGFSGFTFGPRPSLPTFAPENSSFVSPDQRLPIPGPAPTYPIPTLTNS